MRISPGAVFISNCTASLVYLNNASPSSLSTAMSSSYRAVDRCQRKPLVLACTLL